jgi:hypothetical protein
VVGLLLSTRIQGGSSGGEGGIRTPGRSFDLRRFSKPLLSTTQPPLREVVRTSGSMVTHKSALGEAACPGVREAPGNVKCSPAKVSIYEPCYSQGDVHGRIRFDGIATIKTCVIWILGRAGNDVKGKTPAHFLASKPIIWNGLAALTDSTLLWKRCAKALNRVPLSSLRATTTKAYFPSSPRVIMESGSTCRPIVRARIL